MLKIFSFVSKISDWAKEWKMMTIVVSFITTLAAFYASMNSLFGVDIRPAWVWELTALEQEQTVLRIQVLQLQRKNVQDELMNYEIYKNQLITAKKDVPSIVIEGIAKDTQTLSEIDDDLKRIKDKYLDAVIKKH